MNHRDARTPSTVADRGFGEELLLALESGKGKAETLHETATHPQHTAHKPTVSQTSASAAGNGAGWGALHVCGWVCAWKATYSARGPT
jgi:hypothetical protein